MPEIVTPLAFASMLDLLHRRINRNAWLSLPLSAHDTLQSLSCKTALSNLIWLAQFLAARWSLSMTARDLHVHLQAQRPALLLLLSFTRQAQRHS